MSINKTIQLKLITTAAAAVLAVGCASTVDPLVSKHQQEVIPIITTSQTATEIKLAQEAKLKPSSCYGNTVFYWERGKRYWIQTVEEGYIEQGIASWYGKGFHGQRTANSEIYNMFKLTAAHKTLPLGAIVKVVNLDNGKSVVVKINDRGPFYKDRIIDLSYASAKKIGIAKEGIARVKISVERMNYHNPLEGPIKSSKTPK